MKWLLTRWDPLWSCLLQRTFSLNENDSISASAIVSSMTEYRFTRRSNSCYCHKTLLFFRCQHHLVPLWLEKFLTPSTGKCSELKEKKKSIHFSKLDSKIKRYMITFQMHATHWHPNNISPIAFVGKELKNELQGWASLKPMDDTTFQDWLDVGVTMVILLSTALFPLLRRLREDVGQREGCRSLEESWRCRVLTEDVHIWKELKRGTAVVTLQRNKELQKNFFQDCFSTVVHCLIQPSSYKNTILHCWELKQALDKIYWQGSLILHKNFCGITVKWSFLKLVMPWWTRSS